MSCELPWIKVVQQRVVDLFLEQGVTGFQTAPVEVAKFDKRSFEDVPRVCRLIVHGHGGPLIPDSVIFTAPCSACGSFREIYFKSGLLFDEQNWDGSDFFRVKELPGVTLVTQKVADLIAKYKLTNARLVDTRNYPTYPQKKPQV
jgi:hypothetical protein